MSARKFIKILIFAMAIPAYCQNGIKENTYTLKGTIVNKLEIPPHCGIFAWATAVEFDVLQFSDSTYKKKRVCIIVRCPELYKGIHLTVGTTYVLRLLDQGQVQFPYTVLIERILERYNRRFWAIEIDGVSSQ